MTYLHDYYYYWQSTEKEKKSIIDGFNEPDKVIQCYHSNQTDCM